MVATVTKQQLATALSTGSAAVLDVRPIAAYNGWRLRGEGRGGHIPGAIAFPATWAVTTDDELEAALADKNVTPGGAVVVYGYDSSDAGAVVERLNSGGFTNVSTYDAGFGEWAADDDLAVERLPRYSQLVHSGWLHDLLAGENVEAAPAEDLAVFHVNYRAHDRYLEGHIPGSFYLDTNALESAVDWNRRSAAELETAVLEHGITTATTVVLYGRDAAQVSAGQSPSRTIGQIAAARAAAILLYVGVEDVRLLDGGYNGWLAAGYDVETAERTPVAVADFGAEIPARPDLMVDFEEAQAILDDPDGVLVSIRSWAEHTGQTSGYDYVREIGDIPGAVWGNSGTDAYDMAHYRNADNTMRDFDEIGRNWLEAGISPDKKVAFYCGTGWRASEALVYAYLMGWPQVSLYDGGWFEWKDRG